VDGGEGIIESEVLVDGVQAYRSMPTTRMIVPATNPLGSVDATPRYGRGSVKQYTAMGTETVDARDDTTADEILMRRRREML
jgi:hypothetical protein